MNCHSILNLLFAFALGSAFTATAQESELGAAVAAYQASLDESLKEVMSAETPLAESEVISAALMRERSQPMGFSPAELKALSRSPSMVAALKDRRQSFLDLRRKALEELQSIAAAERAKSALAITDATGVRWSPSEVFTAGELSAATDRFAKDTTAVSVRGLRGARLLRQAATLAEVKAQAFAAGFELYRPPNTRSIRDLIEALRKESIEDRIVLDITTKDRKLYSGALPVEVPEDDLRLFSSSLIPPEANVGWIVMAAKAPYLDLRKLAKPADVEYPTWVLVPVQ